MNNQHAQLFHRNKLNPILTADNWPYHINSVFNAGATSNSPERNSVEDIQNDIAELVIPELTSNAIIKSGK